MNMKKLMIASAVVFSLSFATSMAYAFQASPAHWKTLQQQKQPPQKNPWHWLLQMHPSDNVTFIVYLLT